VSTGRRATIVVDYNLGEIRVYLVESTQTVQSTSLPHDLTTALTSIPLPALSCLPFSEGNHGKSKVEI
jgi:hypothetical protein